MNHVRPLTLLLVVFFTGLISHASDLLPGQGDTRSIKFVVPFDTALKQAKEQKRLLFLKPIYGGVDQLGARDYRCGSW